MKKMRPGFEKSTPKELLQLFPWLADAEYQGGKFSVYYSASSPVLRYECGIWHSGNFTGDMVKCEFKGGHFNKWGDFSQGFWYAGTFEGFRMFKSEFYGGNISNGYFIESKFFNGSFDHGIFHESSIWYDGEWGDTCLVRKGGSLFKQIPRKFRKKLKKKARLEQERLIVEKTTENIEDILAKGGTSKKKKAFKKDKPIVVKKPKKVKSKPKKVKKKVKTIKAKPVKSKQKKVKKKARRVKK